MKLNILQEYENREGEKKHALLHELKEEAKPTHIFSLYCGFLGIRI